MLRVDEKCTNLWAEYPGYYPENSGLLLDRRDVLGGRRGTLAKEILFHLLNDNLLIFSACRVQAVLVQQHFAELNPGVPGFLGHIFVNFLAQIVVERRLFEPGKILLQLYAKHLAIRHKDQENYLIRATMQVLSRVMRQNAPQVMEANSQTGGYIESESMMEPLNVRDRKVCQFVITYCSRLFNHLSRCDGRLRRRRWIRTRIQRTASA